jgi:hypothetical protein
MVNKNLLYSKIILKGDNWRILAQKLDMYTATLHCKLRGETEFKTSEIAKIRKFYDLTAQDIVDIFLNELEVA